MRIALWTLVCALCALTAPAGAFTEFESGQVRPLSLSPDGTRLFAVNTPDDRLEIFDVTPGGLTHAGSVTVGLEPVAVAARSATEVWVVNHLSDSVSIVDLTGVPRVVRTLLTCDEPRDIVFAGPGGNRAFITTARRGQNCTVAANLLTAGEERAIVQVFDATNLGATLAGVPIATIELFGDTPRALAVAPGGATVYAAVFQSGNQTTALNEGVVCNGGAGAAPCNVGGTNYPGGLPAPNQNVEGVTGPETGLIVKFNSAVSQWQDQLGRNWNNAVRFSLPDLDVFSINANAGTPAQIASFAHVGTTIFDMAVNPVSGKVYVSNTEARNEVRFEGPGILGTTVRGHLAESRVTVLSGATVTPRHLNKHINYAVVPSPQSTNDASLATPTALAVSPDGATLYVAAFGSNKVGVFSTSQLENDTFVPNATAHWPVSGGGPSGLVIDDANDRLYVFTRFDNAISVLDTASGGVETSHVSLHNPEPLTVVNGRPFLYDARFTSSNGEAACASCHIFGDFDSLAWDLGNPDDVVLDDLNQFRVGDVLGMSFPDHHPLKGPMTTQSLRGMANAGPMHWRGDRSGANDPGGSQFDEDAAFKRFNVAFAGLLGRSGPLDADDMQAFTTFILQVTYPPNPIRALDNSLTPDQLAGRNKFFSPGVSDVFQNCDGCHRLEPSLGHFGTDGMMSFEFETQNLKIPHLRNLYQKVGMFGNPAVPFDNPGDNGNKGPQIRGFGFLHDGSIDTVFRFHQAIVFNQTNPGGFPLANPDGFPSGATGDTQRRQVEQFMLAFDSNLAPIVGQQVTLGPTSLADAQARATLLIARANAGECDVVVKGVAGGRERGWVLTGGVFQSDELAVTNTDVELRGQAAGGAPRTYMCVPPGDGVRVGVDRDEDGFYDGDELSAGSDPADPGSTPETVGAIKVVGTKLQVKNSLPDDELKRKIVVQSKDVLIVPPAPGSGGDPRCNGDPIGTVKARLHVVSASSGQSHETPLPCQNWVQLGSPTSPKGWKYKDREQDDGTAKVVTWKAKNLKATLTGKGPTTLGYDLQVGVGEAPVAARFQSGDVIVCLQCAAYNGKNGSDGKQFLGKTLTCPAPSGCLASPSGAFLD